MVLIVIMCVTTFFTQKQIMKRSGPVEGQAATVQRLMLYGMPISLFVSGFFFPIGVLLYWFTNNLWTLGQQFFILRKMPPPGSAAAQGEGRRGQAGRRPAHPGAEARRQARPPEAGPAGRARGRRRRVADATPPTAQPRPAATADGGPPDGPSRRRRRPRGRARRTAGSASAADRRRSRRHHPPARPAHRPPGKPGRPPPTWEELRECTAAPVRHRRIRQHRFRTVCPIRP